MSSVAVQNDRQCEGCGCPMNPIAASQWGVCLPCTNARMRAATRNGRCQCTKKEQRPVLVQNGVREWMSCERCLGSIKGSQR